LRDGQDSRGVPGEVYKMSDDNNDVTTGQLLLALFFPFLFPITVLIVAGDWFWVEAWIWAVWFVALCWAATIYLYFKDPALLKERFQRPGTTNQKREQAYLLYLIMVAFIAWIVIMPLDTRRLRWNPGFPWWLEAAGGVALIGAFFFIFRSFVDNTFLSPLIRIQAERKQHVVSTGVYGFVRHPMYLGAVLLFFGTPLLLGSLYGILIGVLLNLMLVGRILGEEKMLAEELEGYVDYRKKVRYRLAPFIW
jgi:protein-S-isoprenylcysteine O-methyltransferase Ste14